MALDHGRVKSYSGRGFGFVRRTLQRGGPDVFFHIKVIRRKYPTLADALDANPYETPSFWYDTESTVRGDQVRELWLNMSDIPGQLLTGAQAKVEQIWRDSPGVLPADLIDLAQAILGQSGYSALAQAMEQRQREESLRRREEEQRRSQLEREAEQLWRREAERIRTLQLQARQKQETRTAPSAPETGAAGEHRPVEFPPRLCDDPTSQRPTDDLPEWLDYVDVETPPPCADAFEWREFIASEVPLPQEETGAALSSGPTLPAREDQSTRPKPRSSVDASVGAGGFWYNQFRAEGASKAVGAAAEPRQIETKVVGVTYENRQSVISKLSDGEQLWLCREPDNAYDRNAIRVERRTGEQIGYISRQEAAVLAASFDRYGRPVAATVAAVLRGYGSSSALGVRIRFTAPEAGAKDRVSIPDFRDDWEDQP